MKISTRNATFSTEKLLFLIQNEAEPCRFRYFLMNIFMYFVLEKYNMLVVLGISIKSQFFKGKYWFVARWNGYFAQICKFSLTFR